MLYTFMGNSATKYLMISSYIELSISDSSENMAGFFKIQIFLNKTLSSLHFGLFPVFFFYIYNGSIVMTSFFS